MNRISYTRVIIKFKKTTSNAIIPKYAHPGDVAFDIYTNTAGTIKKGKIKIFSTGIASEFSQGYFVSVRDRSGLAAKKGIHVLAGVIDSGYRGGWGVVLANLGEKDYKIEKGDRIAQGILHSLPKVTIKESKKLSMSQREKSGFGSTGK